MDSLMLFPVVAGLTSSFGHCAGMCGPLQLGIQLNTLKSTSVFTYHLGRITTYGILGAMGGLIGQSIHTSHFPQYAHWMFLILGIIYLGFALKIIISGTGWIEQFASPLFKRLGPQFRKFPHQSAFAGGMLSGLLPCPTTLMVLAWTLSLNHFALGALGMVTLGIFTLPSFGLLLMTNKIRKNINPRIATVIFAVLFSGLAVWNINKFFHPAEASCHQPNQHLTEK